MMNQEWWKKAVFYQIYPRSFSDSTGNGVGDLNGISNNLEYIRDLGVEGIWISPFLASPMKDFGYDVSNYRKVEPLFGQTEDINRLIAKSKKLGLKIIMDLVLAHSSNQHQWFIESSSSKNNPKSDWYVWADPKSDGTPPNNWQSAFGGSAWEFNSRREQYYLHNWGKEQPDLNYHNPEVQDEALSIIQYWLDRGVSGFRFDVANYLFHDKQLRNNPPNPTGLSDINHTGKRSPYTMQKHKYDISQPECMEFYKRVRKVLDQYDGIFTIAEVGDDNSFKTAAEYTSGKERLHSAYTTSLLSSAVDSFDVQALKDAYAKIRKYSKDSWPSWAFSNHDVIRVATRWAGKHLGHPHVCKLYLAILLTLRGSPFIYQGEELGLPEANIPYEKIQDPWGKFLWPEWQGRDGCRTPMPWAHDEKNAGFSIADETWLPIPQSHSRRSVDIQSKEPDSVLNFTKAFIKWRNKQPEITETEIQFIDSPEKTLIYKRGKMICVFNMNDKKIKIPTDLNLEPTDYNNLGCVLRNGAFALDAFGFGFFRIV